MNREETMRALGNAVQKCRSGEPITDVELDGAIPFLRDIVLPSLRAMGDCYYLAAADLTRRLADLESMKASRK